MAVFARRVGSPAYNPAPVGTLRLTSEAAVLVRFYDRDGTLCNSAWLLSGAAVMSWRGVIPATYLVTAHRVDGVKTAARVLDVAAGNATVDLPVTVLAEPEAGTASMLPAPTDGTPTLGRRATFAPVEIEVLVGGSRVPAALIISESLAGERGGRGLAFTGAIRLDHATTVAAEVAWVYTQVAGQTYWGSFLMPEGSRRLRLEFDTQSKALTASSTRFLPSQAPLARFTGRVRRQAANGYVPPVVYTVEVQITKDGERTPSVTKVATVYTDQASTSPRAYFIPQDGFSSRQTFSQAIAREWFFNVVDLAPPRAGILRWPTITGSQVLRFDLTTGDSSAGGGDEGLVTARVAVEGMPAVRDVVLIEQDANGDWRVVGFDRTGQDGSASIEVKVLPDTKIYGMATDDFGVVFAANLQVQPGQRIRPSRFSGWLYDVTEAGTLPAVEPEWWPAIGDNPSRALGSARAVAVRYYQPLAHGPFPVKVS